AGSAQFVDLSIVDLVVGRDAGVADQPLEWLLDVNGLSLRHRAFNGLVSKCFVQIRNALEIGRLQACFMHQIEARQTQIVTRDEQRGIHSGKRAPAGFCGGTLER
ncbi:hypothetical protein KW852_34070, partial [Ensifer sp. ENS12]|nr:hypothetical protein [Ensifer sp. ENS12]